MSKLEILRNKIKELDKKFTTLIDEVFENEGERDDYLLSIVINCLTFDLTEEGLINSCITTIENYEDEIDKLETYKEIKGILI